MAGGPGIQSYPSEEPLAVGNTSFNLSTPCDPGIPLRGTPPKINARRQGRRHKGVHRAPFIIANSWKQQEYNENNGTNIVELLILSRMKIVSVFETA